MELVGPPILFLSYVGFYIVAMVMVYKNELKPTIKACDKSLSAIQFGMWANLLGILLPFLTCPCSQLHNIRKVFGISVVFFVTISDIYVLFAVKHSCLPHSTFWIYVLFVYFWLGAILCACGSCGSCIFIYNRHCNEDSLQYRARNNFDASFMNPFGPWWFTLCYNKFKLKFPTSF